MTSPQASNSQRDKRAPYAVAQAQPLEFTFDGRKYTGYAGDTIAAALYRAGVRVFSRSFKYHRPRGLMCVNGSCPNCLVNVNGTPNVRACISRVEPGTEVKSQNARPSLEHDVMAINDRQYYVTLQVWASLTRIPSDSRSLITTSSTAMPT
jgi:hypothetical protein